MRAELELSIAAIEDARAGEDDDNHIDIVGDVFADRCSGFQMHEIRVKLRRIRQRPLDTVSDRRLDGVGEVHDGQSNLGHLIGSWPALDRRGGVTNERSSFRASPTSPLFYSLFENNARWATATPGVSTDQLQPIRKTRWRHHGFA